MNSDAVQAELENIELQDSYVLGYEEALTSLRFKMLFALDGRHLDFRPPLDGEQHCYRYGVLSFEGAYSIVWIRKTFKPSADLDGEIDYGNIDHFFVDQDICQLEGAWGAVAIRASSVSVSLEPAR